MTASTSHFSLITLIFSRIAAKLTALTNYLDSRALKCHNFAEFTVLSL
jgi:hypothetical protein